VSTGVPTQQGLAGADLAGTTFRTVTPSNEPIDIRIDAVEVDSAAADQVDLPGSSDDAVHRYTIAYSLVHEPGWMFACGVDEGGLPIKAIPLEHLWNYRQATPGGGSKIEAPGWITFACEGFALARCVDLGYRPWIALEGTSLAAHHQACTRMIRADYCGDGRSFSYDDVMVNVLDAMGIQAATPSFFHTEAEWTEAGARCVSTSRSPLIPVDGCTFEIPKMLCGNPPHWDRTLLVSQAP
jgi:hypothetical protein